MQPLVALIGIIMGSSVALMAGLIMTLLVFLLLPEFQERLSGEYLPLAKAIAWAAMLTATSASAFWSQIKQRPWRVYALLAMFASMLAMGLYYWPE